jgi:chromosomal replication initiation ATPase DnaA
MLGRVRTRLKACEYSRKRRAYLKLLGYETSRRDQKSLDDIIKAIAPMHGLDRTYLMVKGRSDKVRTRARWHVWYIAYHEGGFTLTRIARHFDVHHTTVLYGIVRWAMDNTLPCALDLKDVDKRKNGD